MGHHVLLQGIFLTQGLTQSLLFVLEYGPEGTKVLVWSFYLILKCFKVSVDDYYYLDLEFFVSSIFVM